MKILLAASAASVAMALAYSASAQNQYAAPPAGGYPAAGYDQSYDDQDAPDQDAGEQYGQPPADAYGPQGYGQPSNGYPPQPYGPPATTHYPTNGYPRVPNAGGPDMAPQDMDPEQYSGGDYSDQGDGYPTDNSAYPGDMGDGQAGPPPPPRGYAPHTQTYGPPNGANYVSPMEAPADLVRREQRLERQIRRMDEHGAAPGYATDNLMIVLNSIRDQQDELTRRDNGLNFTDRRFIEERLDRLEEQVRALR